MALDLMVADTNIKAKNQYAWIHGFLYKPDWSQRTEFTITVSVNDNGELQVSAPGISNQGYIYADTTPLFMQWDIVDKT